MHVGLAHIGVNEQDRVPRVGDYESQVTRNKRLPLPRDEAGYQYDPGRVVRDEKSTAVRSISEGLCDGCLGLLVYNELRTSRFLSGLFPPKLMAGIRARQPVLKEFLPRRPASLQCCPSIQERRPEDMQ